MNPSISPEPPNVLAAVVKTLVLYSLAEFQLGYAKSIWVKAQGPAFSVGDDGRGHAIDRTIEGAPYLKFIYTHLDYPFAATEAKSIQLHGLGMSLLNTLCSKLEASVVKKTATLRLRFERGQLVDHQFSEIGAENTGNLISGEVDASFEADPRNNENLKSWLQEVAASAPALRLSFNDQELTSPQGDA